MSTWKKMANIKEISIKTIIIKMATIEKTGYAQVCQEDGTAHILKYC